MPAPPSIEAATGFTHENSHMHPIRPLQSSDSLLDITHLLHRAYARLGAMGLNYTAVDQTPETTAARMAGGRCYVADIEGKLAGTIVVKPTYAANECEYFTRPGVAAVHQFAVDPATQGQGIGRALLQRLRNMGQRTGFSRIGHGHRRTGTALDQTVHWPGL